MAFISFLAITTLPFFFYQFPGSINYHFIFSSPKYYNVTLSAHMCPYSHMYCTFSRDRALQMAPYEALYGRPCRSPICWTKVGESSITGPNLIKDIYEKVSLIQQRLLTAQSQQKSYADVRRRPLEFEVGDTSS